MSIRTWLAVAAIVAAMVCVARPAAALNFVVNSGGTGSDAAPGDAICEATSGLGDCTVQAAVQESNATAGNDTIVLPAGDFSADPFLGITDGVIVAGAGATSTTILGNGTETVLYFSANVDVALVGLTVAGGSGTNVGGGITVSGGGRMTLIDCIVRDNTTINVGGGVYVDYGRLLMVGTTVVGNTAGNVGGGVYVGEAASAEIVNSTISANFAGNTSGGLGNEGRTTLNNVTVADNSCGNTGAGIKNFEYGSVLTIANSIIANNYVARFGGNVPQDCRGEIESRGYNLIENVPTGSCVVSGPGTPTDVLAQDPALGGLADNGGPTPTHALSATSPAVNAGNPSVPGSSNAACAATDQRGIDRPSGLRCDIGAFELARCGNGTVDVEEECDDGSNVDGDGCDSNCTVTRCGNGVVTTGEGCDDANTLDGDCCSSECALEPIDAVTTPLPGGAGFAMKRGGTLSFKWKGSAIARANFGNPTADTDVSICLIDTTGATPTLVASARVPAGAGWKSTSSGFSYKARSAAPGTLSKLTLGSGGKISAKGISPKLRPGRLPLVTPVTVVIRTSTGSTVFGAAFDGAKTNRMSGFKARSR